MRYVMAVVCVVLCGCTAVQAPATLVPASAPASMPASAPVLRQLPDDVVTALVRVARTLPALPEQVEVKVRGARWACYRWPLEELLRGRINADTLWSVYVREVRDDGRLLDFDVR